jgi:hypothetical protein
MFHHFPGEPSVGSDYLVRSTDFTHTDPAQENTSHPFYSMYIEDHLSGDGWTDRVYPLPSS